MTISSAVTVASSTHPDSRASATTSRAAGALATGDRAVNGRAFGTLGGLIGPDEWVRAKTRLRECGDAGLSHETARSVIVRLGGMPVPRRAGAAIGPRDRGAAADRAGARGGRGGASTWARAARTPIGLGSRDGEKGEGLPSGRREPIRPGALRRGAESTLERDLAAGVPGPGSGARRRDGAGAGARRSTRMARDAVRVGVGARRRDEAGAGTRRSAGMGRRAVRVPVAAWAAPAGAPTVAGSGRRVSRAARSRAARRAGSEARASHSSRVAAGRAAWRFGACRRGVMPSPPPGNGRPERSRRRVASTSRTSRSWRSREREGRRRPGGRRRRPG